MKIKVFNEQLIQKYYIEESHIVISIQDPSYEFVILPSQDSRIDCLQLKFYDMDEDTGIFPYSKFIFNEKQANDIKIFVEKYKNIVDLILVNCVAGISRSAGVSAALSKVYNKDDSFYFKHYLPNRLVYRKILEVYNRVK